MLSPRPRPWIPLLLLLGCSAPRGAGASPGSPVDSVGADEIQRHVDYLASDELEGRWARGETARTAAAYLARELEAAGLEPFGDAGSWFQQVAPDLAPNVVGVRRGTGPDAVLVVAHYDHLEPLAQAGEGGDRFYNGADDNASGTAAVLALGRVFGALEAPPEASLVCVAFSAEELGLLGSKFFVQHPPLPLERMRAVVNLDMISRGEPDLIFCEGAAEAPDLVAAVERANARVGLTIRYDEHPEWRGASDHAPFLRAGVPTLYFGVEDHPDYHRVSDHADRILPDLAARVARVVGAALLELAGAPTGNKSTGL